MDSNSIVERIVKEGLVSEIAENLGVTQTEWDDFMQEIYLIILQYNEEKIVGMYDRGELKYWLIRVCINQYCSKNSPWYKKYKKYYTLVDGNNFNLTDEILNEERDNTKVGYTEDYE